NLLSLALTVPLLDDAAVRALLPRRLRRRLAPPPRPIRRGFVRRAIFAVLATAFGAVSAVETALRLGRPRRLPAVAYRVHEAIARFHTVNTYGLFAVMTRERPEIVVEGSRDGATWLPYEFKWKPGALDAPPRRVAPHQPRLDWQLWFAALDDWRANPWFLRFL